MENIQTETATLPVIAADTILQPVSAMLRNCLISNNTKLSELDFNHLQMYFPVLEETDTVANGQVLVKAGSDAKYRLESKQIFNYTRIDANEAITDLGITSREFTKAQYKDVVKLLENVGTFTTVEGNIVEEENDAVVSFKFGNDNGSTITPARYIDLGSNTKIKSHYDIAFKGVVKFTFKGNGTTKPVEPANTEVDENEAIDVASLMLNRNLGNIFRKDI